MKLDSLFWGMFWKYMDKIGAVVSLLKHYRKSHCFTKGAKAEISILTFLCQNLFYQMID